MSAELALFLDRAKVSRPRLLGSRSGGAFPPSNLPHLRGADPAVHDLPCHGVLQFYATDFANTVLATVCKPSSELKVRPLSCGRGSTGC